MHAPLPDPRIPVTIVTGFLGSGKTTLLSSLLRRASGERFAVVINEFGEVPLDQAFIDAAGGKVVTLAGGCLCCAIARDIVGTLLDAGGFQRDFAGFVVREIEGVAGLKRGGIAPGPAPRAVRPFAAPAGLDLDGAEHNGMVDRIGGGKLRQPPQGGSPPILALVGPRLQAAAG